MVVCITEKPSVARDIARILGANKRHDGFFEGNGYQVTWTFGHLCCLKDPNDYTEAWKRWALGSLPMIPPKFGIKLINQKSIKDQFKVIKTLVASADEVINCGDAGQEGELIQRWVMQKARCKAPVKRLWISSLTDESIRQGFSDLKPEKDYEDLYYAGLSRAIGDWILGINATRLYSLKYGNRGSILSVGRVQTPTLALIVKRHFEIANFKPEDYWELHTEYRNADFSATSGKFTDQAKAQQALEHITGKPLTVTDVTRKRGREAPPRLFDLTSLQVECNKQWGWSADESLKLIQSLYEKKLTTYPRVDTTYLTDDLYPKIPGILQRLSPYANLTEPILDKPLPKTKKVFDNAKVTDHHAIIPTGESPAILSDRNEKLLYHLIARRFIAAFYPDCIFEQTVISADVDGVAFRATGKVIVDPGWRNVYAGDKAAATTDKGEEAESSILPEMTVGESGPHSPRLVKKTTQPPKPYTEGTLLRAMESAGKTVDDDELREAMKENGIGRPSTRAAIIETLFKRRYIRRERKSIVADEAGIALIGIINEELLKSAKLTGIWENKLRRIERGQYSAAEFINELKALITTITTNVLSDNSNRRIEVDQSTPAPKSARKKSTASSASPTTAKKTRAKRITSIAGIPCPVCGAGHLLKGRTAYGCSNYATPVGQHPAGCPLRLTFDRFSADLTPAKLRDAIKAAFKSKQQ